MDACARFNGTFNITDPKWPEQTAFGIINQTVGWLLYNNNEWVVLAGEMDQDGYPRGITEVPTSLVLEIEILRD